MIITREDIELYVMGEYDGDKAALEAAIAQDETLRAMLAEEAALETTMRDAASDGVFCVGCHDLVERDALRCAACGVAVKPGGYVVERVLVSNAHGRMYIARDADGTHVALKELAFVQTPSLDAIAMFEREAKFLRALEHAAIPRFKASFEEGSGVHTRYYLAQELVSGESLAHELDDHFFSEVEILEIARQVLGVLVYLQSVSPMVIHRDIKPANLIAKPDGKIAVVDFGAAHVQGTTAGSTSIGTFGYMPIEQLAGLVDATTDVYALGASLIHLLSRREPWRLLQGASLEGINVSHPLRDFLAKIVATDPAHRFPDANAALAGLDGVVRGDRITPIVSAKRHRRFARPALIVTAALGLAAAGYGAHALTTASSGDVTMKRDPLESTNLVVDATPKRAPSETIPPGKLVDLDFKQASLHDVIRTVAEACALNAVVPDSIDAKITATLKKAPCDQALEVLLESHGLWYRYSKVGNIVLIAQRQLLDREAEAQAFRIESGFVDDALPTGPDIDLDFKGAPLHDILRLLADTAGINIVVPDNVDGRVTVRLKKAPWGVALATILESHGLWYRYRPNGKLLRIAPRQLLDREAEAQKVRDQKTR